MIRISSLENLDQIIELIPEMAFFKNIKCQYIYFNNSYLKFIKKTRENVINKSAFDLYSIENASKFNRDDQEILEGNENKSYEEIFMQENGEHQIFYTTKQIVYDENNNKLGLFCIAKDITKERQYETIYKDTRDLMEYIAINDNLTNTLDKIANLAEERFSNSKCSILLLNKDKKHLNIGSAKSFPKFYRDAINGAEIGENIGSCGHAAFKRVRVIVENIDTHKNWQVALSLTKKANLHACWSEPIFSSQDELLGTFAIYYDKEKHPNDFHLKLINFYSHLSAIAIEKYNNENMILAKEHELLEQTKRSNEALKYQENELSQIFNNTSVGLMYISGDRKLIKSNQSLAYILGYDNTQEIVGMSMRNLHLTQERYIEFGKQNFEPLKYKEKLNIEYQIRKKDGSFIWCSFSGKALDTNTPADLSKGVLWTVSDISERKRLEEKVKERTDEIRFKNKQLKELAKRDHLTKLYNRTKIDEVLEYSIKHYKLCENTFGLLMVDIDYFKSVNDNYGHQTGDTILKEFSNILLKYSRKTDFVARWGGEEFLIIVNNITKDNIIELAEKLRISIEDYNFSIVKNITASFGCGIYQEGNSINELISRVDEALYKSKKNGRNCVTF